MSDYYESICKLYEKTMQRLEAEDCQDEDRQFLKGEAHAYFTAMQLSEFYSTPDEPAAPVLTAEMVLLLEMLIKSPIHAMYEATLDSYQGLIAMGYMFCSQRGVTKYIYCITDTGRAALKAHQASAEGKSA